MFFPRAFIQDWSFADDDSAVVIQSSGRHGPSYYIKYDIVTQRVFGTVELATPYNDLPEWAKPLADSRPNGFL